VVYQGQIKKALFEYWDGQEWKPLVEFTTVGYKRLLRFNEQTFLKLRLSILDCKGRVQLSEIGFFKASANE
jgi:alpha-L-fucosidase